MSDTSRITPHTINPQHMTTKKDGSTVQDESKGRTIRHIPFKTFIQEVLKLPDELIQRIESRQWQLSKTHLALYEQAGTVDSEGDRCSSVITLTRILLAEIIQDVQGTLASSKPRFSPSKVRVLATACRSDGTSSTPASDEGSCLVSGVAAETGLTQDQAQVAVHATARLSSSSRLYTTGMFVAAWKVTTFYFDHMAILQCESFDFRENTTWFAILLYAVHYSDHQKHGYLQFLRPWSRLEENVTEEMREAALYPIAKVEGAVFDFPIRNSTEVIHIANPDVLRKGVPDKEKQYVSFDILRTHSAPLGLIGRATGVYEADMKLKIPKFPVVPCALKLASQPNYRLDPERVLISDLRKALPSWSDHLPEIYYSDIFTPEELGQPSVAFVEKENQRKLHVTASRIYRKLWEVESVKEFQIVWLQCVQCHYLAFKEGKILHRDLSENNLMFWRKPVMNAKPVLTSVLNDWDMASRLTDSAFAPKTATQNRTGTLPFMAVDLLTPTPPDHYYRHDLESFLYILLWAALRYGFNGKRRQLPDVCKRWGGPDLQDALGFKSILNTHAWSRKVILDAIPAEWASVKTAWIVPLLDLFEKARRSKPTRYSHRRKAIPKAAESPREKKPATKFTERDFFMFYGPPSTDVHEKVYDFAPRTPTTSEPVEQPNYDRSTYGGRLTYKTFMEAIGQSNEDPSK